MEETPFLIGKFYPAGRLDISDFRAGKPVDAVETFAPRAHDR